MNWEALSAIGTISSALAAVSIAVWAYFQSEKRQRKSCEKEAIEKLLTPIRKELDSFTMSKWDNWYSSNRWHKLEDMRLDFPLQYFWLNKQIKKVLEDFDQQFSRFDNLSQQKRTDLTKLIVSVFRRFLSDSGISYEITGGDNLEDENIIHAHWSCVVGGKFGPSVTLYSLVMWGKSLSEFIEERRQDPELPNKNVDSVSFSIHSSSENIKIVLTQQQSDTLLSKIEEEIKKHPEIEEYRKKWQELYDNGSSLIKEIDAWLSEDEFIEAKQENGTDIKTPTKRVIYKLLRLVLVLFVIFGSPALITEKLTPPDYTIRFKRECDGIRCEKIKVVDSERNTNIENEIEALASVLERFDFFARFTFLRFDFQITNKSQFIFAVTEPRYEKEVDIMMQCNLNGQDYVFSQNSGIIFKQKSSLGNIIRELNKIQNILISCNPAPQDIKNVVEKPLVVAPNAQVQFIFNEETYHLKFMPDKWNYSMTVLQMFILTGIFLGAYYETLRFVKKGLRE